MLDKKDFEELFRKEFRGMTLFAMRYVKDHDTAREIVQEVFLGIWEKREAIDADREVKTYLSSSVRNRALNYLRDNKKFDKELLSMEGLMQDNNSPSDTSLEITELEERIEKAIEELPEKSREIFLLNRQGQLKYREIADMLNISVKTVETQMTRALKHMRISLKDYIHFLMVFFRHGSG